MTVYTELLTIANRALRDKWFNGDDEKIRRCIAIIKLQQLTADRNTTGQLALTNGVEAAGTTSLEAQLTSAITELSRQTGTPTQDSMRALLAELSSFTFQGVLGKKTLLELHPEYFTNAAAVPTNPQTTFKGSAFAGVRSDSFESRMANIAREANQALAHQLVPVSASASQGAAASSLAIQNPFDNLFDLSPPGTREQRLAILGFNTNHPLDAVVNFLVNKLTPQAQDLGGEGPDSTLYKDLLADIKQSIHTALSSQQPALSAPEDAATSAIALPTATHFSFVLPASFSLENLGKLNKGAAAALLCDTKNFIDEQRCADQKNIPTAKTLLEAMVCAGYAVAWDTTLRSSKYLSPEHDYPRYSILAALALPSAHSDELTTVNAAKELLRSNLTNYEALRQTLEVLLINPSAAVSPAHAITHQAVMMLMSIASAATRNPGAEIRSTSHQHEALRVLAELTLICACCEFKPEARSQSQFFETLFAAAKRYRMLFAIHSRLNGKNKYFGPADALFTADIIRAIMQEGDYITSKPSENFIGIMADAEACVLCNLAHETLEIIYCSAYGHIFCDFENFTPEQILQAEKFGKYLFAQINIPELGKQSALVAAGLFAANADAIFTTRASIEASQQWWQDRATSLTAPGIAKKTPSLT